MLLGHQIVIGFYNMLEAFSVMMDERIPSTRTNLTVKQDHDPPTKAEAGMVDRTALDWTVYGNPLTK